MWTWHSLLQICSARSEHQYVQMWSQMYRRSVGMNAHLLYNLLQSTVTPPSPAHSLIVVYNASEMTRAEADAVVLDTVHTCLIEIHSCESCMTRYSRDSCSFDPLTTDSPPSTTHKVRNTSTLVGRLFSA